VTHLRADSDRDHPRGGRPVRALPGLQPRVPSNLPGCPGESRLAVLQAASAVIYSIASTRPRRTMHPPRCEFWSAGAQTAHALPRREAGKVLVRLGPDARVRTSGGGLDAPEEPV